MRRRPQEQHDRKDDRFRLPAGMDSGGAGKDRKAACQPANNDVGPASALQPHSVNYAVNESTHESVECGPPVGGPGGHNHCYGEKPENRR